MITFQIVLTTVQIATLQVVQSQNDFLIERGLQPGEFSKLRGSDADRYIEIGQDITQYISAVRSLRRERLVRWDDKCGHTITEKGRLALRLIEMDIEETSKQLKALIRPRAMKQLKKGSA